MDKGDDLTPEQAEQLAKDVVAEQSRLALEGTRQDEIMAFARPGESPDDVLKALRDEQVGGGSISEDAERRRQAQVEEARAEMAKVYGSASTDEEATVREAPPDDPDSAPTP